MWSVAGRRRKEEKEKKEGSVGGRRRRKKEKEKKKGSAGGEEEVERERIGLGLEFFSWTWERVIVCDNGKSLLKNPYVGFGNNS